MAGANPLVDTGWNRFYSTIFQVHTDEGITGISEIIWYDISENELMGLKARLIGEDPSNIERIVGSAYFSPFSPSISAIEIACWDIFGKAFKVPVYNLMGGLLREKVPVTRFIGIRSPEEAAREAVAAVEQGVMTVKLKVGFDPRQDVEIVKAVRDAVGNDVAIRIDPNQAWSVGTAINQINKMAKYYPQYIEQPIPGWDHNGLLRIREKTDVPLCICEGLTQRDSYFPTLMHLIKMDAIDFVSSSPIRTGGLLGFKKLCAICEAAGISVVTHWSFLGVSSATLLQCCASNRGMIYANDIMCTNLKPGPIDDIITEPFMLADGCLKVPNGPGLGVKLDEEKMMKHAKYAVQVGKPTEAPYPIENLNLANYSPPRY